MLIVFSRLITDELIANGVAAQITGETSDGYHTFNELYHHRAVLFSVICNVFPELAWKSKQHDEPAEPMYEDMFIVGIQTPEGQATYHYDIEPYWDMFHVKELERAPVWDGHTPAEAIRRIGTLTTPKEDKHGPTMDHEKVILEAISDTVSRPRTKPCPCIRCKSPCRGSCEEYIEWFGDVAGGAPCKELPEEE